MKILYASVINLNADWGAEVFMNNAFLSHGLQTICVDYRQHRHHMAKVLNNIQDDFDIFLLQRGDYFPLPVIDAIQRPLIFYFSELLTRSKDADHLFQADTFDYYFVRGHACRELLLERQWISPSKIGVLLSAFSPAIYHPLHVKKEIDVLFVGSMTVRRKLLFDRLTMQFDLHVEHAFGQEANTLYNRAKIVLNIHGETYLDTETRVFEVLGSGAFLLSERLAGESPFLSGIHLIEIDNEEDLVNAIAYYLSHPEEREVIAAQGYKIVISHHTYEQRVQELLTVMKQIQGGRDTKVPAIDEKKLQQFSREESWQRMRQKLFAAKRYASASIRHIRQ